jgi:hypothetical protein
MMLFNEGEFPDTSKLARVTSMLEKEGLDADVFDKYHSISKLSTSSKIVELIYT